MKDKITQGEQGGKNNFGSDEPLVGIDGTLIDESYIKRLAGSISVITFLPSGTHWICILGNGDEKNNEEALHTWVTKHISEFIDYPSSQHIDLFLHKFQEILRDYHSDNNCL